jgi:preprotein translocase subunit SecG
LFTQYLPALRIIQIVLCVAVIVFVLLQARSAGLGSAFGGMGTSTVFKTRRGVERLIFNATIVFIVLFCLISIFIAAIH